MTGVVVDGNYINSLIGEIKECIAKEDFENAINKYVLAQNSLKGAKLGLVTKMKANWELNSLYEELVVRML